MSKRNRSKLRLAKGSPLLSAEILATERFTFQWVKVQLGHDWKERPGPSQATHLGDGNFALRLFHDESDCRFCLGIRK